MINYERHKNGYKVIQPITSQFVKIVEVVCLQLCVKCFQFYIFCGIDNIMNFQPQIVLVHFDNSVEF